MLPQFGNNDLIFLLIVFGIHQQLFMAKLSLLHSAAMPDCLLHVLFSDMCYTTDLSDEVGTGWLLSGQASFSGWRSDLVKVCSLCN